MTRVVCAVMIRDGKILATRRKKGQRREGLWEFPGGKVEDGESPEVSLVREIFEELGLEIIIQKPLLAVQHTYPDFKIELIPYLVYPSGDAPVLTVHDTFSWITPGEITGLNWCHADWLLIEKNKIFFYGYEP